MVDNKKRTLLKEFIMTQELFGQEEFLLPDIPAEADRFLINTKEATLPTEGISFTARGSVGESGRPRLSSVGIQSDQPLKKSEPQSSEYQLQELYNQYQDCRNCALGRTRNKIVFGMGSLHPKVLFIGEGPGYEEDKAGLPFVGKAGALLDKIMKAIGLDRNTAYIANIVKCHPMKDPGHPGMRGNDRPPLPEEIEACSAILNRQIEILDPPLICALGATAAKTLLKTDEGITRLRGKVYDFQFPDSGKTVPLIPTYHPAALLRNELLKKDVWQDMKLLKKHLEDAPIHP